MFDIGFSEIVVIAVVALVVIGPEKLPKTARTLGVLFGRLQRYVGDVKADINREMELDELRKLQQEMNRGDRHQAIGRNGGTKRRGGRARRRGAAQRRRPRKHCAAGAGRRAAAGIGRGGQRRIRAPGRTARLREDLIDGVPAVPAPRAACVLTTFDPYG